MPVQAMVVGFSLWAAAIGPADLPPPYQNALRDLRSARDPAIRARAAVVLAHGIKGVPAPDPAPDIVDALADAMLADADVDVQTAAAYALCVLGDPRGVSRAIAAVQATLGRGLDQQGLLSEAVRLPIPYLYRALGNAGGAEATSFLIEVARTGPPRGRVVAIEALGLVTDDDGQVERALATLSADSDGSVRRAARNVMSERRRPSGTR